MTTSKGGRVFDMLLVKGSKPTDLVILVHDQPFDGSVPDADSRGSRHTRKLTMLDAAAIINADIKNGRGAAPLTSYVPMI